MQATIFKQTYKNAWKESDLMTKIIVQAINLKSNFSRKSCAKLWKYVHWWLYMMTLKNPLSQKSLCCLFKMYCMVFLNYFLFNSLCICSYLLLGSRRGLKRWNISSTMPILPITVHNNWCKENLYRDAYLEERDMILSVLTEY